MKRYCLALLFLFTSVMSYVPIRAASGDIEAFSGQGTLNNIDVWRLDQSGIMYLSTSTSSNWVTFSPSAGITLATGKSLTFGTGGNANFSSLTVSQSTTATSGTSNGLIFTAKLQEGSGSVAATEGMVVCAAFGAGNVVTSSVCPAGVGLTSVIGIAKAAASTGSVVNLYSNGWVLALTTGTVNPGDPLTTSALSAGSLQVTQSSMPIVGVALGTGNSNGGLTRIRLN